MMNHSEIMLHGLGNSLAHKHALKFRNANEAFKILYDEIDDFGFETGNGTKALFNVGFFIQFPQEKSINIPWRKWSDTYAEREWQWYKSANRSVEEIKKFAPIWDRMHSGDNIVNSNYGYQWGRNSQLAKTAQQLIDNPNTRQAWITIHDGKDKDEFEYDTPCTLSIGFQIIDGHLCMNVHMRSNDLWYGFCNDQYCFAKLQENIALDLNLKMGWYYHFAANLHIYERHYSENIRS